MRRLFNAILAGAVALGLAAPALAQDKVIKLGTMAWEDMVPITGVVKKALENKGYTVEVTEFSEWGIAYAALTRGDVQVMASQIDYVAQDYWDKNINRLEKVSIASHGLYQGLAVPDYVEANSIEELNDNADKLGGKIVGIEPGSGLMRETGQAVEKYGLKLQLIEGSTAGMTAALDAAVTRQEPIVVTLWTPTWMAEKYKMKFLADPQGVFAPPQAYVMIAQKGFSEANPEAREIIAGVFMPIADIAAINSAVVGGQSMDAAIQSWIDSHEHLVERWGRVKSY